MYFNSRLGIDYKEIHEPSRRRRLPNKRTPRDLSGLKIQNERCYQSFYPCGNDPSAHRHRQAVVVRGDLHRGCFPDQYDHDYKPGSLL